MKNKKSKSPNILKCQVTGNERMSNATYIANKASKNGTTSAVWASFYVSKDAYRELKADVEGHGLDAVAHARSVDRDRLKKWLRFNGRGRYTLPTEELVEMAA